MKLTNTLRTGILTASLVAALGASGYAAAGDGGGASFLGSILIDQGVKKNNPSAIIFGEGLRSYGNAKAGRSEVNVYTDRGGGIQRVNQAQSPTWYDGKLKSGWMYVGQVLKGYPHGSGTVTSPSGFTYMGDFYLGKKHGRGTAFAPDGSKYDGEFRNGKASGVGTYLWVDGSKYYGDWLNDMQYGHGTAFMPDGSKYEGDWLNGKQHGRGTFFYPNGSKYVGEFRNGKRSGVGTLVDVDGVKYEGDWLNDQRHGRSTALGAILHSQAETKSLPATEVLSPIWIPPSEYGRSILVDLSIINPTPEKLQSAINAALKSRGWQKEEYSNKKTTFAKLTKKLKKTIKTYKVKIEYREPQLVIGFIKGYQHKRDNWLRNIKKDVLHNLAITPNKLTQVYPK